MCGIVGYYQRDQRVARLDTLQRMLAAVQHRGPNMQDVFTNGPVALGNSRLSIIDLSSSARLPIMSSDRKAILAYNGEIYNFRQLGAELERAGVIFSSTSDSEVALYALIVWGVEEAVRRFHGMFAFAYYDIAAQSLTLARDPLGIKPLYLASRSDVYIFGSEIKSLLQHPAVLARANVLAIVSYLNQEHFGDLETPFEGVESVLPGHIYTFSKDTHSRFQYFNVEDFIQSDVQAISSMRSRQSLCDDIGSFLDASIRTHLVSDAPVAVLCSGGLDSSYITAVAHQAHSDITAYVADVQGARPEAERARRVCQHIHGELRVVPVTELDFLRTWPEVIWWNDIPSTFGSDIPLYLIAKQCRIDGIKVLLTGEGADELFCGYPWLWQGDYLLQAPLMVRFLASLLRPMQHRLWPWLTNLDSSVRQRMAFGTIEAPDPYQTLRNLVTFHGGTGFARQHRLIQHLEKRGQLSERVINAACLNTLRTHLAALLHRTDRMGMGASVECRVPYLHLPLMQFVFNTPLDLRYRAGVGKRVLKDLAVRRLPRDIVFAHKWGFSVSQNPYRLAVELLRDGTAREILRWSKDVTDLIVEQIALEKKPTLLYPLISLDLWGRIFLRGESPSELSEQLLAFGKSGG